MKTVRVYLSTYNGEKYLRTQLDSILNQKNINVDLLIRDDGSRDNTVAIIKEYCKSNNNIELIVGQNEGSWDSFLDLIFGDKNYRKYDYFALADQDDRWHDDKLICAVEQLQTKQDQPALYYSRKILVDGDLQPLPISDEYTELNGLGTSLLETRAFGCTMVFNYNFMNCLRRYRPFVHGYHHDSWIYRLATAIGCIIYDKDCHIDYRLHGNNQSGAPTSRELWMDRLRVLYKKKDDNRRTIAARQIYDNYNDLMSTYNRYYLYHFANIRSSMKSRCIVAFSDFLKPREKVLAIPARILVLLGWM